jgi:dTDP-4-dehydrorhamnose 3,5-epimerase
MQRVRSRRVAGDAGLPAMPATGSTDHVRECVMAAPSQDFIVEVCAIADVRLVRPARFADSRGIFSEVYNRQAYAAAGIDIEFVQDNHARSRNRGTVRGLHFQAPPHGQDKLVWVSRGAIFDVAVDVRHGSPTFGKHASAILSADSGAVMLVPKGFAHGYCTLEADTDVIYKVSAYYAPAHDVGLLWDDPALAIPWPIAPDAAILSERDRRHPTLSELPRAFTYEPPISGGIS